MAGKRKSKTNQIIGDADYGRLQNCRSAIAIVDRQIAVLVGRRIREAGKIAAIKHRHGIRTKDVQQERAVREGLTSCLLGELEGCSGVERMQIERLALQLADVLLGASVQWQEIRRKQIK